MRVSTEFPSAKVVEVSAGAWKPRDHVILLVYSAHRILQGLRGEDGDAELAVVVPSSASRYLIPHPTLYVEASTSAQLKIQWILCYTTNCMCKLKAFPAASSLANSSFFLVLSPPQPTIKCYTTSPSPIDLPTHIRRSIVAQPYPEPPRPPDKIGPGHRHPKAGRKCFGTSRSQPCECTKLLERNSLLRATQKSKEGGTKIS